MQSVCVSEQKKHLQMRSDERLFDDQKIERRKPSFKKKVLNTCQHQTVDCVVSQLGSKPSLASAFWNEQADIEY